MHAISTSSNPAPRLWRMYVDATFITQKIEHTVQFLEHINSINSNIQFTTEKTRPDVSVPFLQALVTPEQDIILSTAVYRKPTHTE